MGSAAAAVPSAVAVQESFAELERQRELIASCTTLWKELSEHFSALERGLEIRSASLRSKRQSLDDATQRALDSLHRREVSIDSSVDRVLAELDERRAAALQALSAASAAAAAASPKSPENNEPDLAGKLRSLCATMDADGFLDLVVAKKKEMEVLRAEIPTALGQCIDPAKFVMDAISRVFPVDKRVATVKSPNDLGWACVLILESLVPVQSDPELGSERLLVTRVAKERAKEMAKEWKEALEQRGGMDRVKPPDAHTFLQHVVTFGIVAKEDKKLYRRLVVSFAWRRQMPKLALSLGLQDEMEAIIEELVSNGHQLDAINFAYEAGLQEKFPPVPLLESFLKESKKVPASEDHNSGQTVINRKEQSVLRAAMKCIEDHKLQSEFPLENLQKRLEQLEKAKAEKKKPSPVIAGPANKRTRANNGGPMPPAKAGRLTNNAYVSSFPAAPAFVRSPSAHTNYPTAAPAYPYDRQGGHGVYGSRSPPSIRDPYGYPAEEVAPVLGAPYMSPPMNYPAYGGYNNGLGGYSNPMAPAYQQAYYR